MLFRVTGLNNKGKQIVLDIRAPSKQHILTNMVKWGFTEVIHTKQLKG